MKSSFVFSDETLIPEFLKPVRYEAMTGRKTTVLRFKIDDLQQMKWEFPKAANKLYKVLLDLYKLIVVKR